MPKNRDMSTPETERLSGLAAGNIHKAAIVTDANMVNQAEN
jgi:hypothetical protein